MASGGFRAGAGRPKGAKAPKAKPINVAPDIKKAARKSGMSPLDYMLTVMNDDQSDNDRRDRMAIAAAPYVHEKPSDKTLGKKELQQLEAEKVVSTGRFATPPPPKATASG
jgi:hypothetical protein